MNMSTKSDPPPPAKSLTRWIAAVPSSTLMALLTAVIWFGWTVNERLARVETDLAAMKEDVAEMHQYLLRTAERD